ncbi:hypothetical protein FOMPIDRAFT_1049978 [Fomitopsis schrenkii]|uniref:Uncharacterized protein n=1 Tax=Fomitopsis schrenkii TaxID=2126942 RepID=S8E650_FOMSC|nr:hypothetical protein FOMPIDRAFT_1049978 [Fomitopsis schrenkii]
MPVHSKLSLSPEDTTPLAVTVVAAILQFVLWFCDLVLGAPIVAGQYLLCHLPSPHGDVYAAAGIDHAQTIGRHGGLIIAFIASLVILGRSLRHYRAFKKHIRLGVITLPTLMPVWKYLNTRGGVMATLVICVLQGVVGAYAQSSGKGSTRRQLDVIQAGFAGAVGALLIQLALGFIDGFVVERDKKASSRLTWGMISASAPTETLTL